MQASTAVIKALAVTAELTGTDLSAAAARVMAGDLARYPEPQVLGALQRCRREVKGRLTVADVVTRLDDGRPGPEVAWAMMPRDEAATVVWTEEMAYAWGLALPLLQCGEEIPARMAFLEAYRAHVAAARDAGVEVEWKVSLGHDKNGREGPLVEAVALGRITPNLARSLLHGAPVPSRLADMAREIKRVSAE